MPEIESNKVTSSHQKIAINSENEKISMDEVLLEKLRDVVESNLRNEQFTVEDLADEAAYSRSQLHRKLQKLTGESISQFIRNIRLKHGLEYLKNNVGTVSEIAFKVGFGSSTYFIKCFHDRYGFPPGEVKQQMDAGWSTESHNTHQSEKKLSLESLHPGSDESMILEVFHALLPFKPSLEKFLIVDEDEGEKLDVRLLAYQIIKSYPWPIGVELRRLFTASMLAPGQVRCNQLHKTITQILKLLVFLLNSELVSAIQRKVVFDKTSNQLIEDLNKLDTQKICQLIIAQRTILTPAKGQLFVAEIETLVDDSFCRELQEWQHLVDAIQLEQADQYEEYSASLEQSVIYFLKKTAFLAKYKLVNLKSILVKKSRFKSASFEHQLSLLNSTDAEFNIHQETYEQYADSSAVLLMKSIKNINEFLNLSPFVIDTHGEENDPRRPIKRDLFLFDHFDGEKLHYHGSEMNSEEDLSTLPHYQDLVEEYCEVLKLLKK